MLGKREEEGVGRRGGLEGGDSLSPRDKAAHDKCSNQDAIAFALALEWGMLR